MSDKNVHPMQPIIVDSKGCPRFKQNKLVRLLLDTGKLNLSDIDAMRNSGMVSAEDFAQLMQLIG